MGLGKTAISGTAFNTPAGYVTLVISDTYANNARFRGAAMSVRIFLTMHMGYSTDTTSTIHPRLPKSSRCGTVALSRVINRAGIFDAERSDFFTRKSENAQATKPCSSIRGTVVANDIGGHAFG